MIFEMCFSLERPHCSTHSIKPLKANLDFTTKSVSINLYDNLQITGFIYNLYLSKLVKPSNKV